MEYQNPPPPEGINVSAAHPLVDFVWMLATVAAAVVALVFALSLLAQKLLPLVPFSVEQAIAERIATPLWESQVVAPKHARIETYLQSLAERLVNAQPLPEGISIAVHYADNDRVNAFATLGGHIVIYRGLLEKLPDENALAMVMGHEIGHVRFRHPLLAVGRGLVVSLALATVAGASDATLNNIALNLGGDIALRKYGRDQERAADAVALRGLVTLYGHTSGSTSLFRVLQVQQNRIELPEFLSTHPMTAERIAAVEQIGHSEGWQQNGQSTPLPTF